MTKQKCATCSSCGMPLEKAEDHAHGDVSNPHCIYCVHQDGSLKSYKEIHEGTVNHFMQWQGIEEGAAKKMATEMLQELPFWKNSR